MVSWVDSANSSGRSEVKTLDLTPTQIGEEIDQLVREISRRRANEFAEVLGISVAASPPTESHRTPLGRALLDLFGHVRGDVEVHDIHATCEFIVRALWAPPAGTDIRDHVPDAFWHTTIVGRAIREAIGDVIAIPDNALVTPTEAARLAGVSRKTIHIWAQAGILPPAKMERGVGGMGRRFRAGDVRRVAESREPVDSGDDTRRRRGGARRDLCSQTDTWSVGACVQEIAVGAKGYIPYNDPDPTLTHRLSPVRFSVLNESFRHTAHQDWYGYNWGVVDNVGAPTAVLAGGVAWYEEPKPDTYKRVPHFVVELITPDVFALGDQDTYYDRVNRVLTAHAIESLSQTKGSI